MRKVGKPVTQDLGQFVKCVPFMVTACLLRAWEVFMSVCHAPFTSFHAKVFLLTRVSQLPITMRNASHNALTQKKGLFWFTFGASGPRLVGLRALGLRARQLTYGRSTSHG